MGNKLTTALINQGLVQGVEESSTPITDDSEGTIGTGELKASVFTMPSLADYYRLTGLEWKNGTVVDGTVLCGLSIVDADPPVANEMTLIGFCKEIQTGADSLQRSNNIVGGLIPSGAIVGIWVWTSSATGEYRFDVVASQNRAKTVAFGTPPNMESTAWGATTVELFLKAYFRGYTA